MNKTSKKRNIDKSTPIADIYPLGGGRFALNAKNGIACTLTGAHHYAGMNRKVINAQIMAIRGRCNGNWRLSERRQKFELGEDITNAITSVAKDNYVVEYYEQRNESQ